MKIGIDLDGIVADYHTFFIKYLNDNYTVGHGFTMNDWTDKYFTNSKLSQQQVEGIVRKHSKDGVFERLEPIRYSAQCIRMLNDSGHIIHFITGREGKSKADSVTWLDKQNIPYHSISFTKEKGRIAYILDCDVVIEDESMYAEDIAGYDIETLLMDKPYNKNTKKNDFIHRVEDWKQVMFYLHSKNKSSPLPKGL